MPEKSRDFEAEPGVRLDVFLRFRLENVTRGFVQDLIERGHVKVGGKARPPGYKLRLGEKVEFEWPKSSKSPELKILFEDEGLLIIEKPAGLIVHPAGETWLRNPETALTENEPSVVSWMLERYPGSETLERCGLVHRLDRETSGVMAVAKEAACQHEILKQFRDRTVAKVYAAVVTGRLPKKKGIIEAPIGRVRRRLVATPYGREARSSYIVLREGKGSSLVEVRPETGRTHQIRVHLSAIGHPVIGDEDHDGPTGARLFLHAHRLKVERKGKPLEVVSEVPAEFWMEVGSKPPMIG